jgi:hypothetical protein
MMMKGDGDDDGKRGMKMNKKMVMGHPPNPSPEVQE